MPLIGSRIHAVGAIGAVANGFNDEYVRKGNGAFRTAVLHAPTDVIYKVERPRSDRQPAYSNAAELRNAARLRRMCYPDGWWSTRVRIPKTSGFRIDGKLVVAMEHIDGDSGRFARLDDDARAELSWLAIEDMHGGNFVVKDGVIYPIDLGSTTSPKEENFLWEEEWEARWALERAAREEKRRLAGRPVKIYCHCGCGLVANP